MPLEATPHEEPADIAGNSPEGYAGTLGRLQEPERWGVGLDPCPCPSWHSGTLLNITLHTALGSTPVTSEEPVAPTSGGGQGLNELI